MTYSLGGRMQSGTGTSVSATLNNPRTLTALNLLKTMRWTDNSMGSNFDYGWSDINQAFAAGNVGMYISRAVAARDLCRRRRRADSNRWIHPRAPGSHGRHGRVFSAVQVCGP